MSIGPTSMITPEQLLSQIRSARQSFEAPAMPSTTQAPNQPNAVDFGDLLKTTINSVNDAQSTVRELRVAHEHNPSDVSLAEVMIAGEKAKLSFEAVTEVRNKLVTAYQDIMKMPV